MAFKSYLNPSDIGPGLSWSVLSDENDPFKRYRTYTSIMVVNNSDEIIRVMLNNSEAKSLIVVAGGVVSIDEEFQNVTVKNIDSTTISAEEIVVTICTEPTKVLGMSPTDKFFKKVLRWIGE